MIADAFNLLHATAFKHIKLKVHNPKSAVSKTTAATVLYNNNYKLYMNNPKYACDPSH